MKLRILILLLPIALLHNTVLHAQEQDPEPRSLFGSGHERANGGWGGPAVALTEVMGTEALLVGLHAGWLIDHRFTLGVAGYGLVTDVPNQAYDAYLLESGRILNQGSQFRMGYGGLLLEPIIAYKSPVHISLPIIVGAGGCAYETYGPRPDDFDPETHDYRSEGQAFFVLEPGVEVELNLVRMVRIGVGASYRYTTDIDLPETPTDALRGFNTSLTLKVGRF
ncbi:MAG: hypothetical protein WAU70_09970 [Flavobacteriales bacterium]